MLKGESHVSRNQTQSNVIIVIGGKCVTFRIKIIKKIITPGIVSLGRLCTECSLHAKHKGRASNAAIENQPAHDDVQFPG